MSGYSERLSLAREAWREDLPDEAEVRRNALHLARRVRRFRRAAVPRRTVTLVAAALVLIGALAYAASGRHASGWLLLDRGAPREGGLDRALDASSALARAGTVARLRAHGASTPGGPRRRGESPLGREESIASEGETARQHDSVEAEPARTSESGEASVPRRAERTAALGAEARERSSDAQAARWRAVSAALARDDGRAAADALHDLNRSPDAATRAKAKLGLARLALAGGDRSRARHLAEEVARTEGLDPSLVSRATRLVGQLAEPASDAAVGE